jgi:2-oxoisovalerate dehydrogenase E1 component
MTKTSRGTPDGSGRLPKTTVRSRLRKIGADELNDDALLRMLRYMKTARTLEDRMWLLHRSGRVPYLMPHAGHEACQVGAGLAVDWGTDWVVPYYRDMTLALVAGLTPEELMLGFLSKATDPSCGGRQVLGHYGKAALKLVTGSSCVAMHILHAVGIALALKMTNAQAACLTTFGEGATSEGDFHEGLSFAAIHQLPVVFMCENNGYAITVPAAQQMPVSAAQRARAYGMPGTQVDGDDPVATYHAVARAMKGARQGRGPSLVEALVYRLTPHSSDDDDSRYRPREEVEARRQTEPLITFPQRLRQLGILTESSGTAIDLSVAAEVDAAQEAAEQAADPHPSTLSLQVFSPAPRDESADAPDIPGMPDGPGESRTLIEAIREAIADEMEHDPRVLVFGQDVGVGGVFGVTQGLSARFGASRCFSTPIAESLIVGIAVGAALAGLRPIAEIQFSDYSYAAFNQIVNEAARVRYRSMGDFSAPIVIRAPFGGGVRGSLYHSQSPEAMYCHVPGLKVVAPSNPYDAKGLLIAAIRDSDPVLFLEHKWAYRRIKGNVPEGPYTLPIGRARVARAGSDASVITYGAMVHRALAAAEQLAGGGIEVEVVDLRTLRPLDERTILETVRKTGRVLLLTEANPFCAVTSELGMLVAEQAFDYLDAPLMRLTGPDSPAMPFAPALEDAFVPSLTDIGKRLRALVEF